MQARAAMAASFVACAAGERKRPSDNGSKASARPVAGPRSDTRQNRRLNPERVAMMNTESAVAEMVAMGPSNEMGLNTSTRTTAQTTLPANALLNRNSIGDGQGVRVEIDRINCKPTKTPNKTVRCETKVAASANDVPAAPIGTVLRNWNTPA